MDAVWKNAPGLLGADSVHLGGGSRDLSARSVPLPFRCEKGPVVKRAFFTSPAERPEFLSGDPTPYVTAIEGAVQTASDATNLASLVDAILDDADGNLSGLELDIVYQTASLTIDSWEYWLNEGGIDSTTTSMETLYGSCLTVAEEPSTCLYDASRTGPRAPAVGFVRQVSNARGFMPPPCEISGKNIVGGDVGGFFGGLLGSGGNPVAGLFAGVGTSGGVALVEVGFYLWCTRHQ